MFGDNSSGFANEIEIMNYLNTTKYFDDLNNNFKMFLSFIFNENLSAKTIRVYRPNGQVKPDLIINIGERHKHISLKKGGGNSVHQEQLALFESFLISSNISRQSVNYIKEFHYGDGSMDGTGPNRMGALEWQLHNAGKIDMINREINSEAVLSKFFNRFLFSGNLLNAPIVDAIYHGSIHDGLWATKDEIINHLKSNNNRATSIHFSHLTYQAWNRNLNYNPGTANRRHVMQIKWPSLYNDFVEIQRNRY